MYEETRRQGVQGVQDICLSTPNPQKTEDARMAGNRSTFRNFGFAEIIRHSEILK